MTHSCIACDIKAENVHVTMPNTGMDAQVAYGFHNLRNEKPYLAQGPVTNKVCI